MIINGEKQLTPLTNADNDDKFYKLKNYVDTIVSDTQEFEKRIEESLRAVEVEIATLDESVSGVIGDVSNIQATINEMVTDISGVKTDVATLSTSVQTVQDDMRSLTETLSAFETETNTKIENLQTDLSRDVQTLNARIEHEAGTLNNRIDSEVSTINEIITTQGTTINGRIDTEVATINTSIANESTARSNADNTLQGNINTLDNIVNTQGGQITALETSVNNLSTDVQTVASDVSANTQKIAGLENITSKITAPLQIVKRRSFGGSAVSINNINCSGISFSWNITTEEEQTFGGRVVLCFAQEYQNGESLVVPIMYSRSHPNPNIDTKYIYTQGNYIIEKQHNIVKIGFNAPGKRVRFEVQGNPDFIDNLTLLSGTEYTD